MRPATTTAPYTKPLSKIDFQTIFRNASYDLIEACDSGKMLLNDAGRPIGFYDGITFINWIAIDRKWSGIVRKTFLQCYVASESKARASGILACYALSKFVTTNHTITRNELRNIFKKSKLVNEEIAISQITKLIDVSFANLFFNIVNLIGVSGQINIRNGTKSSMALEIFSGHNFEIGIDPGFCTDTIERDICGIFLVDGAIEKVSEIDRLLQYCLENNMALLIVARKFSNDVISTLNANFQRGTLNVVPVLASDKISSLNIFSDLSITTNGNVINEHSGQTIIGVDPKELTFITGLKCSRKNLKYNSISSLQRAVKKRISELKIKIDRAIFEQDMSEEDIRIFLRTRINSLSTAAATLWLPTNSGKNGFYKFINDQFYFSLGFLDGFCKFGGVELNKTDLKGFYKNKEQN